MNNLELAKWINKFTEEIKKNSPYYAEFQKNIMLIRSYEFSQYEFYKKHKVPPEFFGHIILLKG